MRIVCSCSSELEFEPTRLSSNHPTETEMLRWWKTKHDKCAKAWQDSVVLAAKQPPAPSVTNYRLPSEEPLRAAPSAEWLAREQVGQG